MNKARVPGRSDNWTGAKYPFPFSYVPPTSTSPTPPTPRKKKSTYQTLFLEGWQSQKLATCSKPCSGRVEKHSMSLYMNAPVLNSVCHSSCRLDPIPAAETAEPPRSQLNYSVIWRGCWCAHAHTLTQANALPGKLQPFIGKWKNTAREALSCLCP